MAVWLPGWTVHEFALKGKPYQFTHNPKGCLHTTEGSSIAGALAAYAPYPPHGIYDWRTREKLQHIALNFASYSAMDGNDDDYIIQIELVGKAAEVRYWPDEAWRNIAEDVLKPLEDNFGIPRVAVWKGFADAQDGLYPYISTPQSPIRLSWTELRDFSGWLAHQNLPAPDDHWDAGKLQLVEKAFPHMSQVTMQRVNEGETMFIFKLDGDGEGSTAMVSGGIVSGVSAGSVHELNRKANGTLLVGVTHQEWYDIVGKSQAMESVPRLLADVLAELKKLNAPSS
jgi:hypothetical protein